MAGTRITLASEICSPLDEISEDTWNMEIDNLYPLIVPAQYLSAGWELPHYRFPNKNFVLTWVFFNSKTSMTYIKADDIHVLDANFKDWRQITFENLRNSPPENATFYTEYKVSDVNGKLIFIACLNEDGIGSSRILFSHELQVAFPNGYYVAMPDRSCGLIVSKDISNTELNETKTLVKEMYKGAGINMSDILHLPDDFELPEEWVKPISKEISQYIIDDIVNITESR